MQKKKFSYEFRPLRILRFAPKSLAEITYIYMGLAFFDPIIIIIIIIIITASLSF